MTAEQRNERLWSTREQEHDPDVIDIVGSDGRVYGEWYQLANVECPEDMVLHRDVGRMIDVGVAIGRAEAEADRELGRRVREVWEDDPSRVGREVEIAILAEMEGS